MTVGPGDSRMFQVAPLGPMEMELRPFFDQFRPGPGRVECGGEI